MMLNDIWEKNKPLFKEIIALSKSNTALFTAICTLTASVLMFWLNALEFALQIGYYHFKLNIPIAFLGSIHMDNIPISFVFGIIIFILLFQYSSVISKAYIECKPGKYLFSIAKSTLLFFSLFVSLVLILSQFLYGNIKGILTTHFFFSLFSAICFCFVISFLVLCIIFYVIYRDQSDAAQIEHSKKKIASYKQKKEQLISAKWRRDKRLKQCDKKIKTFCANKTEAEERIRKKLNIDKEKKTYHILKDFLISASTSFAFLFIAIFVLGILLCNSNNEFNLIYTDSHPFTEQIIAELNTDTHEVSDNDNVNGLVELFRNEEHIVIAPCIYSESKDEITIYTTYQHVLPVENSTYVRKDFNHLSIQ